MLRKPAAAVAGLLSLAGIAYLGFAIQRVVAFRKPAGPTVDQPPVTILKPLCGAESQLYENLRSVCDQSYPAYQIVFGVRDRDDPAIAVVDRIIAEFPALDLALVVDAHVSTANPKVANLANMIGRAKHGILVIADSDMRVDRAYLRAVVAPFADPRVGAVTCLYGGTPVAGIASRLGAMFINDQFAPSVLVARSLEELRYCLGATMAVRRDLLAAIGGFEALGAHVADDHELGRLASARGFEVVLAPYVVTNVVDEPSLRSLWDHELRWARTIRSVRPIGFACSLVTHAVPMAVAFAALSPWQGVGLGLVAVAGGLRVGLHYAAHATLQIPSRPTPWLIPARDAASLAVWIAAFFGRRVRWRSRDFSLHSDGRLSPHSPSEQ
ncbi:MAG: bacteriohopanetetrol glucosamine biosynthesis glycosyltransferase HpnI [Vulcanimicrobiaceae bacterium]